MIKIEFIIKYFLSKSVVLKIRNSTFFKYYFFNNVYFKLLYIILLNMLNRFQHLNFYYILNKNKHTKLFTKYKINLFK